MVAEPPAHGIATDERLYGARQAEAERERRAKVIAATGELQASAELAEAADRLTASPGALQLRTLQTLAEVATERNSTLIFPIPFELLPMWRGVVETVANGVISPEDLSASSAGSEPPELAKRPRRDAANRSEPASRG